MCLHLYLTLIVCCKALMGYWRSPYFWRCSSLTQYHVGWKQTQQVLRSSQRRTAFSSSIRRKGQSFSQHINPSSFKAVCEMTDLLWTKLSAISNQQERK